ncbi:MAG: hypothetical protein ACK4KV_03785 [Rhodocyclaceae bacterium]
MMGLRLARLWQPRHPKLWLWVVVKLVSWVGAWVVHNVELVAAARLVVAVFALTNVVLGLLIMLRLMRTPED